MTGAALLEHEDEIVPGQVHPRLDRGDTRNEFPARPTEVVERVLQLNDTGDLRDVNEVREALVGVRQT